VPLTQKWLHDFKFDFECRKILAQTPIGPMVMEIEYTFKKGAMKLRFGGNVAAETGIQFVHNLQNLCAELNREELTLK
jgi:hypothetical protein